MKKIIILLLLVSSPLFASEGFTWISQIIHKWHLPIAEHTFGFILIGALLILAGIVYRARIVRVANVIIPDKGITFRNIVEAYGQFIYSQCRMVLGEKQAPRYFSFIATVFIIIYLSNMIGLIPGFLPPTEHLSTTLALGVFAFAYYNFVGVKEVGIKAYMKHFAGPIWYMAILIFPIEIISHVFRPCTLALRLRGNMFGDHLVLSTFTDLGQKFFGLAGESTVASFFTALGPIVFPIPFYFLGLLVSFIQAYVFTMLTLVYITLAVSNHDHDAETAH